MTTSKKKIICAGVPMVRAGCVHREHGNLRDRGGGQTGPKSGDAEPPVL